MSGLLMNDLHPITSTKNQRFTEYQHLIYYHQANCKQKNTDIQLFCLFVCLMFNGTSAQIGYIVPQK